MLWDQMITFLKSFFIYSGLGWDLMLVAILLALAWGAVWLCAHWIPLKKESYLLTVIVASALLTLLAVTFIQIPLQYYAGKAITNIWDSNTIYSWLLLIWIPMALISGLVQEGVKMVPIVFWWRRTGKKITPKMGLFIGAAAGAGFGIFEAIWAHGQAFAAGWTTQVMAQGFLGISPFWERFFTVGFHIACSALAGWGLAKGKGWQFFLIASGLHTLLNWSIVLPQKGYIGMVGLEVMLAIFSIVVVAAVMYLRWYRKDDEVLAAPADAPEPPPPAETPNP